jgi:stress-induced morphogen
MRVLQMLRSFSTIAQVMSTQAVQAPVEAAIRSKLAAAFTPVHFDVINESYKHNVPNGAESHFVVIVVSDAFDGKSPIQRHRMVNQVLEEELKNSVHALSIQAKTRSQWAENPVVNKTPNCLGGDK